MIDGEELRRMVEEMDVNQHSDACRPMVAAFKRAVLRSITTLQEDDTMPCGCSAGSCYCDGESGVRA